MFKKGSNTPEDELRRREKISKTMQDHIRTEAHRFNISKALKGRPVLPPERISEIKSKAFWGNDGIREYFSAEVAAKILSGELQPGRLKNPFKGEV